MKKIIFFFLLSLLFISFSHSFESKKDKTKVPFTGATSDVNLGTKSLTAGSITGSSGTIIVAGSVIPTLSAGTILSIFNSGGSQTDNCRFAIVGGTAAYSIMDLGDKDNNAIAGIQYDHTLNRMIFRVNALNPMIITSGGNIGMNDSTADAQLDIVSNASATGYIVSISSQNDVTGNIFGVQGNGNVAIGSGGRITLGDGTIITSTSTLGGGAGDNLGNHTATQPLDMGAYTINSSSNIKMAAGTASVPSYSFQGDSDTGMYRVSANILGFSAGSSAVLQIESDEQVMFRNGTVIAPSISYLYDTNTGIYTPGTDTIGITGNGTDLFAINPSTATFFVPIAPYSQTEAQLKALAPTKAGCIYYDSTNLAVVVSTGTGTGAFGLITDGTQSPTGW